MKQEYIGISFIRLHIFNGILIGLVIVLITLLVLGFVTEKVIFNILFLVIIFLMIAAVFVIIYFFGWSELGIPSIRKSTKKVTENKDSASTSSTKQDTGDKNIKQIEKKL